MVKTLIYESAQYEYSSYIKDLFMIISRCGISSLHCVLNWLLAYARLLHVVQLLSHSSFSNVRDEHTCCFQCVLYRVHSICQAKKGGRGDSLLSLALLLEYSFSSKLRKVNTEQKILQKQTVSVRCGSPFLCI